jgi:hypothetical protein
VSVFVANMELTPITPSTVVTEANNYFILDFVLIQDYIELQFYAINVPRFAVLD